MTRMLVTVLSGAIIFLNGCQGDLRGSDSASGTNTMQLARLKAEPYPIRLINREHFDPIFRPATVSAPAGYEPGTVVIDTEQKLLYHILPNGRARRFGIAVGTSGYAWKGSAIVGRRAKWPAWYPTDDMHQLTPGLPKRVEPGPHNPLGARALYLYKDGKDTLYRIHGTSEPWTIGTNASSGCIRMFNEDIVPLFDEVEIGSTVIVK